MAAAGGSQLWRRERERASNNLTEHVGLRERAENGDLVTEDLAWWPAHTGRSGVNTVDDQLATTPDALRLLAEHSA